MASLASPRLFSDLRALRDLMFKAFSPHASDPDLVDGTTLERTERAQRGDNWENRIPFSNRRTPRTRRIHKYRARSVGVSRRPSAFLRSSRPSRSYVQGFLPPCVRSRLGRRYHPRRRTGARSTGRQLGKPGIPFLNRRTPRTRRIHKYRARSVGVSRRPSDFLRSSRPSRSYVQGVLPTCVRSRLGRRYHLRAHRARSTGRQLGKPNSILEQKDAKDAKNIQIRSPIGWGPSLPLGFSPIFAPFAILCSRLSPSSAPSAVNGATTGKTEFHFRTEGRQGREEYTNTGPDPLASHVSSRIFSDLRALRDLMFEAFSLERSERALPGDNRENRIPFSNRRTPRTRRIHKYGARSVGVPRLPSAFLRSSRPSRSYVQGFLPPCVRSRLGRRYQPRAHRARSTGRQLGKPNSIFEQKDAKDAKNTQIPSPIGWRLSPPLGFSPIFAPFATSCSRISPPCSRFGRTAREGDRDSAGAACAGENETRHSSNELDSPATVRRQPGL